MERTKRGLRAAGAALMAGAGPAPDPETIKRTVEGVLSQDIYQLEAQKPAAWFNFYWLIEKILEWIDDLVDWLVSHGAPIGPGAIQAVLWTLLILLLVYLAYNLYALFAAGKRRPLHIEVSPLTSENTEELIRHARACAERGAYSEASRALHRAALILLEKKRGGRFREGLTASEYVRSFRQPWVRERLGIFVQLINWKYYRDIEFDAEDYVRCLESFEAIEAALEQAEAA